ncbi:tetratricopeptide repeat protein [bacterium]|nr:tetratricopeptide repeat protein [bacterium]
MQHSNEDDYFIGRIYKLIGDICFIWGKLSEAEDNYNCAAERFSNIPFAFSRINLDLGNIALQKGEWEKMEKKYCIAERNLSTENNEGFKADIEINRGVSYSIRGLFDKALARFRCALSIAESIDDHNRLGSCYLNISIAEMESDILEKAMDSMKRALGYAKETGDFNLETTIYINRAKLSFYLKDYMVSQFYAEKALELLGITLSERAEITRILGMPNSNQWPVKNIHKSFIVIPIDGVTGQHVYCIHESVVPDEGVTFNMIEQLYYLDDGSTVGGIEFSPHGTVFLDHTYLFWDFSYLYEEPPVEMDLLY